MATTKKARTAKAKLDMKLALLRFRYDCEELEKRSFSSASTIRLAKDLKNLCDSLIEWGEFSGHVEVWGCFTPELLDYSKTDKAYADWELD